MAARGTSRQPHGDPLKNLTSRVSFKFEEGDLKGLYVLPVLRTQWLT